MLRKVLTESGWVRGIPAADPRVTAFKGIPFAAPAVGPNRWRAPQPPEPWEGVRDCLEFGPIAMQEIPGGNPDDIYTREWHVDGSVPMSEDCLQLNVWTNAQSPEDRLPVMVWIYGGGLMVGYPSEMEMDGERIARRGVVLVSINYRVNVFGFLAHPELTAESPEKPTNFGHLDQQAGIAWVKRNIAAFGGDPENITIFGQSAGGGSCMVQLVSPQNRGLFQRTILHSGGGLLPPSSLSLRLEEAEAQGVKLFEKLGVKTLAEARALDARTVWDAAVGQGGFSWGSVIGDAFLPDTPANIILRGEENEADIIIGNTGDEFIVRPEGDSFEALEAFVRRKYPGIAEEFMSEACCCAITLGQMRRTHATTISRWATSSGWTTTPAGPGIGCISTASIRRSPAGTIPGPSTPRTCGSPSRPWPNAGGPSPAGTTTWPGRSAITGRISPAPATPTAPTPTGRPWRPGSPIRRGTKRSCFSETGRS